MSVNRNHFQGNMKIPEQCINSVKIFGIATHMAIKLISYIKWQYHCFLVLDLIEISGRTQGNTTKSWKKFLLRTISGDH